MNIKETLDNYLEFDSSILFFDPMIRIFGGCIRDILIGEDINDVDILCGSKSYKTLSKILISNQYNRFFLSSHSVQTLYSDIRIISEPVTFIKGKKVVQLIRPSFSSGSKAKAETLKSKSLLDSFNSEQASKYRENFIRLISNVDLTSSGVSYDGNLYQNCKNSILHILNKKFHVNSNSAMYSVERTTKRYYKLEDKGWQKITNLIAENRDMKILSIDSNQPFYIDESDITD